MKNKNLVLKVDNQSIQHTRYLNKIIGTIDLKNLAKLINSVGLEANPRKSKVCNTTDQIRDTLEYNPAMFKYSSKGLLVSSSECHKLERGRLNLTYNNESVEGILDGGHNTLACGLSILEMIGFGDNKVNKIKKWDEFIAFWKEVFTEKSFEKIDQAQGDPEKEPEAFAQLPIEIIYPTEEGYSRFEEYIYFISAARNNNTALSVTTRSNHRHYYDALKKVLDEYVSEKITWKDNEETGHSKPIKSQEIIALSLIPLITLQKEGLLPEKLEKINPVSLYSSKGKCVQIFDSFIKLMNPANEEGREPTGEEITQNLESNELIMSAFEKMFLIPELEDCIVVNFPKAYNKTGKKFAKCPKVQRYSSTEKGPEFTNRKQKTQYYEKSSDYKYPKGFYMPIVASINALMHVKKNRVEWRVSDPKAFLEDNLDSILRNYFMFMESHNADPQVVGKSSYSYEVIESEINKLLQ
jgi:hypothetical protein